jgi:hypothetical protein
MVTRKKPDAKEQIENVSAEEKADQQIRGRSAFNVELTPAGVVVNTVFVAEDESVRPLPAVFPNLEYALNQIDALRNMVVGQFAQAAELGMRSLQDQAKLSEVEDSQKSN